MATGRVWKMILQQIKSRFTGDVIFECYAESLKIAVEIAVKSGAILDGANLYGANLSRANLSRANLYGAILDGANLYGANLYGAILDGANLYGANLSRANLYGANLYGAILDGAILDGANLDGAILDGAMLNWNSHQLLSEILHRESGDDYQKIAFSGAIRIHKSWCWQKWLDNSPKEMVDWALDVLAKYVVEGDDAPDVVKERVKK